MNETRRSTATAILLGLLFGLAGSCGGPDPHEDSDFAFPSANLILLSVDTLRADHLSAYGYPRETSPNLDRWSREGILFRRTLGPAPKTATSHMSLLTGFQPSVHGVRNWWQGEANPLPHGIPTLASTLSDAGYRCGAFTGGGNVSGALGFARGFERYDDHGRGTLEDVVQWATNAGEDQPFFLFFHTFEVHDPYMPPVPYDDAFDVNYRGPLRFLRKEEQASLHGTKFVYHDAFWERFQSDQERERKRLVSLYDGEILYTDRLLGNLVERLEGAGLLENSILVFTADHGEEFFERGGTLHNTLHREILHVPWVMRLPGKKGAGTRIDETVGLIDVMPTLLDLLGIEPTLPSQGRSLVPLFSGESVPEIPLVAEWKNPKRDLVSLQEGSWKLIWDRKTDRSSLYSVEKDPDELQDLASQEPLVARRLRARILELETRDLQLGRELTQKPAASISASEAETRRLQELGYLQGKNEDSDN